MKCGEKAQKNGAPLISAHISQSSGVVGRTIFRIPGYDHALQPNPIHVYSITIFRASEITFLILNAFSDSVTEQTFLCWSPFFSDSLHDKWCPWTSLAVNRTATLFLATRAN